MKNPIHIMIVDDDEDDVDFLQEAFARKGANIHITVLYDGLQALDRLNAIKNGLPSAGTYPDVMLLDLNMPIKDGYKMLCAVKADAALKHIPVFVLTVSVNPLEESLCLAAGCERYFIKPVSVEEYDALTDAIINYIPGR